MEARLFYHPRSQINNAESCLRAGAYGIAVIHVEIAVENAKIDLAQWSLFV
jgi:hypothetical protein